MILIIKNGGLNKVIIVEESYLSIPSTGTRDEKKITGSQLFAIFSKSNKLPFILWGIYYCIKKTY